MDISDLSKAAEAKSDQINAADLIGSTTRIKISRVTYSPGAEQPIAIYYDGDNGRPFKPCKTMIRALNHAWGVDGNVWIGQTLELYCDGKVKWQGKASGGVRIKAMTGIKSQVRIMLPESKHKKVEIIIEVLSVDAPLEDVKLVRSKRLLIDSAKKGVAALSQAWGKIPNDIKKQLSKLKDECKAVAVASDEQLKATGMHTLEPELEAVAVEVEAEAPPSMDQF